MRQAQSLLNVYALLTVALLGAAPLLASAQGWKPERPVELIVGGISQFMGAAAMKKYMEEEYAELKVFLAELELAKK